MAQTHRAGVAGFELCFVVACAVACAACAPTGTEAAEKEREAAASWQSTARLAAAQRHAGALPDRFAASLLEDAKRRSAEHSARAEQAERSARLGR